MYGENEGNIDMGLARINCSLYLGAASSVETLDCIVDTGGMSG